MGDIIQLYELIKELEERIERLEDESLNNESDDDTESIEPDNDEFEL